VIDDQSSHNSQKLLETRELSDIFVVVPSMTTNIYIIVQDLDERETQQVIDLKEGEDFSLFEITASSP